MTECAAALSDVLAAAPKPLAPSLELELERLPPLLRQCAAFVEKFSKKMYLRKVLSGHNDAEQLRLVDKALTDCVQNVALSLGAAQLDMQRQQFDKLDQIAMLVSNANDNKTLAPDSAATKEIATCSAPARRHELAAHRGAQRHQGAGSSRSTRSSTGCSRRRPRARSAPRRPTPRRTTSPTSPKQDFFRAFWDDYFVEQARLFDDFVNVFEADFCPSRSRA